MNVGEADRAAIIREIHVLQWDMALRARGRRAVNLLARKPHVGVSAAFGCGW